MKECIEVIKDSFTDYAGKVHHFIIAAVSEPFETPLTVGVPITEEESVFYSAGTVQKGLHLGVAICNPDDVFDEKIGVLKATGRAKSSPASLYSSENGQINTKLVRAFLEQEAAYLKSNPDKYIKGYSEAKERWLRNKSMKEIGDNLSDLEQIIVDEVKKDSKFLDNIGKYIKWLKTRPNA